MKLSFWRFPWVYRMKKGSYRNNREIFQKKTRCGSGARAVGQFASAHARQHKQIGRRRRRDLCHFHNELLEFRFPVRLESYEICLGSGRALSGWPSAAAALTGSARHGVSRHRAAPGSFVGSGLGMVATVSGQDRPHRAPIRSAAARWARTSRQIPTLSHLLAKRIV